MTTFAKIGWVALALLNLTSIGAWADQSSIVQPITGPHTQADLQTNYLNPALRALLSNSSGSAAPANGPGGVPVLGQFWLDTSTTPNTARQYDGTAWAAIGTINAISHVFTPYIGGLAPAPSATTDTTNAGNITSGLLAPARGGCGVSLPTGLLKGNGATPCTAATGADIVAPTVTVGTALRSILSFLQEGMTVRDFGASCGGTTDDTVGLTTMQSNLGHIVIPQNCTARIATATTFTVPIEIKAGGIIEADGVTVSFNGGVQAPPFPIFAFANGGLVKFGTTQTRYPEWWSATSFSSSGASATINTGAFNAAAAAGPGLLEALGASYTLDNTFIDLTPKLHITGRGDQATTLHLTSATANQVEIGIQSALQSSAAVGMYGSLRNVLLIRDVAPSVAFGAYPYTQPAKGVSIRNAIFFDFDNVDVYRSRIGFYQRGNSNIFYKNHPIAQFNFTLDGGDAIGFFLDGQDDPYPGTGLTANASTTLQDPYMFCYNSSGATILSAGFRISGNFSDQWLTNPQTSAGCNGIDVEGQGAVAFNHLAPGGAIVPSGATSSTPEASFTVDLNIHNPIIDGFPNYGIRINAVPANTPAVSIGGGYLLQAANVNAAALDFEGSNGISVSGGLQCIAWYGAKGTGAAGDYCLSISGGRSITVDSSVHFVGASNPVSVVNSAGLDINPTIQNFDNRGVGNPAIVLQNVGYSHFAPGIDCFTTGGNTVTGGCFSTALTSTGATSAPNNSFDLTKALPYAFPGGLTILSVDGTSYTASGTKHFGATVGASSIITGSQP